MAILLAGSAAADAGSLVEKGSGVGRYILLTASGLYQVISETIRVVTAYNAGDSRQTDDAPCIDASGQDLCQALSQGRRHCAANFVPLGTYLHIDKFGGCRVTDRTNPRYRNRVDIAMPKEQLAQALQFGRQKLQVRILERLPHPTLHLHPH